MADLVLALAKSAVEGTLTVARSVEEEEKLKKSVQRDVMIISDEFEMMCSFLNVAKERSSDEMVKTLVRQVRNMALDVEDCIESVVLRDIESNWWRRWLPSCMPAAAPAAALDNAVSDIELLKSRVEAMGQRNERYRHIGDSSTKPTNETHQQALADATARGILMEARDAKHSNPTDLSELISEIDSVFPLQVISVWGAVGDLGVASIIKKTCDDPKICEKFRCRAWVKLMHPFNPHDFIRSLLAQFYTNYGPQQGSSVDFLKPTDVMRATEDVLIEKFTKLVSNQRYLVFLEDVSSTVDWETVKVYLPDEKNGSCIVVHTQQLEVASLCVGQSHKVLELEQFSTDHSVCVFFNERRSSSGNLMELINKKDRALPLQVIAVSGAVGDLGVASIIKKSCEDDPEICQNFTCRAWVKLMHPLNRHEFIRSLLAQLYTNYCPQHGRAADFLKLNGLMMSTEGPLIELVKQVMSDQRYLVFLEDLSSEDDWNAVKEYLLDKNNGSCIVVHTQQPEVVSLCVGQSHRVLELEQSSSDHSARVFFNENSHENEKVMKMETAKEWLKQFKPVGRQADICFLSTPTSGVRAVYGVAGVGKSYIVKHVYHKAIHQGTSFEKFGWVDVSHPFDLREFSWNLLLDLHSGSLQYGRMSRIKEPIQDCRKLVHDHKCLIVIDGLKSTEEWDLVKTALAFGHNVCSYIIVIAYERSVAKYCSPGNSWSVHGLEIDEALTLFKNKVEKTPESSDLEKVEKTPESSDLSPAEIGRAKFILHKCGGLPKVIVSVADIIAGARSSFRESYLRAMSAHFMQILESQPEFGSLRDMFAWVHSYFDSCQDSLKPCIFYLSIFPMNHNIRRRRLVRRWIAEGYSRNTKERTAEEDGEASFYNLYKLNMIQVPGTTRLSHVVRMPLCQFNGFFREYIISRSLEENLVFTLEGHCNMNSQRTGRHLTIETTWDRDRIVYESIDFSKLRSLTVFGRWESFFISDKMRIVRVLDLEDASSVTDGDLEQIIKLLPRLKFLSLRGRKEITRLPDSIGSLRQLQTLDIRHTSVITLPQSITKLQKLQHIRAGTTVPRDDDTSTFEGLPPPEAASVSSSMSRPRAVNLVSRLRLPELWTRRYQRLPGSPNGGVEVPRGLGKMMALHNISVIDVSGASGRAILEDLKNLTQLRKLGVTGVKRENCQELCSAISGHAHLESLSLWLDKNQAGCFDAISPPPEKLQSLKLYGRVDKLPLWIKQLSNLRKLKLQMTMVTQDDVDLLMGLLRLNTLCLCFKEFQYGELRFRAGFWRLRILEITCNCRLQAIIFDQNVMPQLEVLKICCCNVSSLKFSGLKNLNNLREVSLSGSYDAALLEHMKNELDEHPREMKPVLKV